MESVGWIIQLAPFIIVDDQKANNIGQNILPKIGIKLVQDKPKHKQILKFHEKKEASEEELKSCFKNNFQELRVRIGKSKNHVMRTQFLQDINPIPQKGRRIPSHLKERVEVKLNKLIDQKHIKKLDKCSDKQFINPITITVKKD